MKSFLPQLAGVCLLALASLISAVSSTIRTGPIAVRRAGKDEVSSYLERFEPLRTLLPSHATVGYEADPPDPRVDREEARRFYLTQYAMAPVIVVAGADRELVIGNYRDRENCRVCKSKDFALVADLGDGLMLFRRVAR